MLFSKATKITDLRSIGIYELANGNMVLYGSTIEVDYNKKIVHDFEMKLHLSPKATLAMAEILDQYRLEKG